MTRTDYGSGGPFMTRTDYGSGGPCCTMQLASINQQISTGTQQIYLSSQAIDCKSI